MEGLTEFIPVSSTGHLILAGHLLGFTGGRATAFEIFIQIGAILAVAWECRGTLVRIVSGPAGRAAAANVGLGFLPVAAAGLLLHGAVERYLFSPTTVGWGLLLGGAGILAVEAAAPAGRLHGVDSVPWRIALGIGLAQCLSLLPGVSRSAATIMGGMALGLDRRTATEFSFILAVPTMLAASLYSLIHWRDALDPSDAGAFAVGLVTAFAAGLVSVRFLLRYVSTHDFRPFAWYRIAAGAAALWILGRG